ncbi:hypothetical protein B0A48_07212 [Cryoendolithus antarcticus]|uniref:F-box domain-containing protein n=1 Tax=Cryoendolithus antarcticus TaxID=1507870 RepID=A0A1V8T7Y9_9PEZI|nr:hypothetical protein B0A48_07212 [Cryoendolithus antarcticus]
MAGNSLDGALETSPLLRLPYDIRVEIYRHLFPRNPQLHLMADKQGLSVMLSKGELPMNVFTVCRQIHSDTSGYLYNNYLFNVVGLTSDCIARYEPLQQVVRKHARGDVKTDIFDNGVLSSTACISIYVSGGFVEGIAHRRRRGVPRELSEVKLELAKTAHAGPSAISSSVRVVLDAARLFRNVLLGMLLEQPLYVLTLTCCALALLLAIYLGGLDGGRIRVHSSVL